MKFIALLSSIISLFLFSPIVSPITSYALIGENCLLYSDESVSTSLFSLPQTYFVQIIDTHDDYYKVAYLDVVGYVKAESATIIDYLPLNKYPTSLSCTVQNDGNTITLRSSPFVKDDNVIARVESNEVVEYYGYKKGDKQIEQLGNTWYYIKDKNGNFGYVYNLYLTPPSIPQNDYTAVSQSSVNTTSSLSLSSIQSGLVIAFLSALFIILLFFAIKPKSQRN